MRTPSSPEREIPLSLNAMTSRPAPNQLVLTKVSPAELALKLESGQLGPLRPCCYSPASNTLKMLSLG